MMTGWEKWRAKGTQALPEQSSANSRLSAADLPAPTEERATRQVWADKSFITHTPVTSKAWTQRDESASGVAGEPRAVRWPREVSHSPGQCQRAARSWVKTTAEQLGDRGADLQRTSARPSGFTAEPALWFFHQRRDPEFPPSLRTTVRGPAKESRLKLPTEAQSALRAHIWPSLSALALLGRSCPPGGLLGNRRFSYCPGFSSPLVSTLLPASSSYQLRSPQQLFSPEPRLYLIPRPHDNQTCPVNPSTSLGLRQKPHFRLSLLTWRISAIKTSHSSNSKSSSVFSSNISPSF